MSISNPSGKIRLIGICMNILLLLSSLTVLQACLAAVDKKSSQSASLPKANPNLYKVKIEHKQLRSPSGLVRSYIIYVPEVSENLPAPPFPAVVLIHGFLMSSNQVGNNAKYLAERGIIVLTPNLTRLLWGDENRMQNVKDILADINWLVEQNKTANSPLQGLVNINRIAVAGNSSGGAVCLQLVIEGQKANIPIYAMCSLEGVPWDRSWTQVPDIKPIKILTVRSEPCLCNYYTRMLLYLQRLKFPYDDVKINGAHHCDAENPTTFGCMSICGKSHAKYRQLFQQVTYLYLRDTLGAPKLDGPDKKFSEVVQDLQNQGTVVAHLGNQHGVELSIKDQTIAPNTYR